MTYSLGDYTIHRTEDALQITCPDNTQLILSPVGAAVRRFRIPVNHVLRDIVFSFADTDLFADNTLYAGATLAPAAGRISHGKLPLSGKIFRLSCNENSLHNLHGGYHNASFMRWQPGDIRLNAEGALETDYTITLPDGLDGFPGNRCLTVTYTLAVDHSLRIDYMAVSDADTYINMSNHSYFNLASTEEKEKNPSCALDHDLMLCADQVVLTDEAFIPTNIIDVTGTPFDFRIPAAARENMKRFPSDLQLQCARGFNHAFILDTSTADDTAGASSFPSDPALSFTAPQHDLTLNIYSDAPCVTFYSAGFMDDQFALADGSQSAPSAAFAFEMQDYPDAPGGHDFPFEPLKAGDIWSRWIMWKFS